MEAGRSPQSKVLQLDRLQEQLNRWRSNGDRIVFTNGCFDLLHLGHLSLLEQASKMGDRLLIGLNSDESIKRLKGESRPIKDERSRALILASFEFTDAVITFEQDTPLELIRSIRPDVLVKGGDYTTEQIVGAKEVLECGGRLEIVQLVKDASSTRLIDKASK